MKTGSRVHFLVNYKWCLIISKIFTYCAIIIYTCTWKHNSAGKESACNAGDPSSIPGLGRSAVEGIGYPPQYSWASLVAQMVKNLPAMRETWVQSLGWEDPLEKGMDIDSNILAWRIPWTEEPGRLQSMGSLRVRHDWVIWLTLTWKKILYIYIYIYGIEC